MWSIKNVPRVVKITGVIVIAAAAWGFSRLVRKKRESNIRPKGDTLPGTQESSTLQESGTQPKASKSKKENLTGKTTPNSIDAVGATNERRDVAQLEKETKLHRNPEQNGFVGEAPMVTPGDTSKGAVSATPPVPQPPGQALSLGAEGAHLSLKTDDKEAQIVPDDKVDELPKGPVQLDVEGAPPVPLPVVQTAVDSPPVQPAQATAKDSPVPCATDPPPKVVDLRAEILRIRAARAKENSAVGSTTTEQTPNGHAAALH